MKCLIFRELIRKDLEHYQNSIKQTLGNSREMSDQAYTLSQYKCKNIIKELENMIMHAYNEFKKSIKK